MIDARLIYTICNNHESDDTPDIVMDMLGEYSDDWFFVELIESTTTNKKFNFFTNKFMLTIEKCVEIEDCDMCDVNKSTGIWVSDITCDIVTSDYTEYTRIPNHLTSKDEKKVNGWITRMIVECKI